MQCRCCSCIRPGASQARACVQMLARSPRHVPFSAACAQWGCSAAGQLGQGPADAAWQGLPLHLHLCKRPHRPRGWVHMAGRCLAPVRTACRLLLAAPGLAAMTDQLYVRLHAWQRLQGTPDDASVLSMAMCLGCPLAWSRRAAAYGEEAGRALCDVPPQEPICSSHQPAPTWRAPQGLCRQRLHLLGAGGWVILGACLWCCESCCW